MSRRPRARSDLGVVDFDGEVLVYDPVRPDVHYLNSTAGVVFALCDGSATIEQTAVELADAYGVSPTDVEPDVRAAVADFSERGLLDNGRPSAAVPQVADDRAKIRLQVPPSD
jgi:PqqD family protein of HPr-rel-A system